MKKYIIYQILFLSVWIQVSAQVDRSQIPESGPTPVLNLGKPDSFTLGNGLEVLVVENHKLPRITLSLTLDNDPTPEGGKAGIATITSGMLGKGTTKVDKNTFNEEVDFLGASLEVGVNGGFAQALSKYTDKIFELFSQAALDPNFTQEELDLEKKKLIQGLKAGENSADFIAGRVRATLAYGKNHPRGEFTTEKTVNTITLNDVKSYYLNNFVPKNAYLVITGDIDKKKAESLVKKYFVSWTGGTAPSVALPEVKDAQYRQINFIDVPNAVQTEMAVMGITDLKMTDKDYHAARVANYILGGSFNSYINMNLREAHGYTYGGRSSLPYSKNHKSAFRASAKVRNAVTDSAVVETLKEIKRIRTEFVNDTVLKNAKAKFLGDFILASERDRTIADRSVRIKTQNLPEDFYTTFISKINDVTKEDVKRVAEKYFPLEKARIVLVGNAGETLENLEKIQFEGKKIPILFFDKYGKKTEKPQASETIPEGLTATAVIDKYLKAIGGEDKLKEVRSLFTTAEASMNGATLTMLNKVSADNKMMMDVQFAGNSVNKNVFDGTSGYVSAQGQKVSYTQEQINQAKKDMFPFPELNNKEEAELKGIVSYEQGKAYQVNFGDKKTSFYDMETGLGVKDVIIQEQGGQKVTSTILYKDYKEINGIKFPQKMTISFGPQQMDFTVKDVKINEGVSEEDFK
ncbi:insulinase family protein [Aquimarina sp. ERC-38]|uniref:M16 family metallopeptidase n=1 Tax=Aquimarina sp. ERC-38 TaxID=2949996 RepID=UPI002248494E|nr:pitrilysin family protein [Aquimarina sp. ERC-38]UZO79935.1 insulinase family protein [Aquimarina sp. ERC-38]